MGKMLADPRVAVLLWAVITGQAAYRGYEPSAPHLWASVAGACLPATLIIGIGYLIARSKYSGDTDDVNDVQHQSKSSNIVYALVFCALLGVGYIAFSGKGRPQEKVVHQSSTQQIKTQNGQLLLDTIKQYMPDEYSKIDTLAEEQKRSGKTDEQIQSELMAVMFAVTSRAVKKSSMPTLKKYFTARLNMMSELAAQNPEKAFDVLNGSRPLTFDDLSPQTNQRTVEVLRDVIIDGSQGQPVPQNNDRATNGLRKVVSKLSPEESNLILSDMKDVTNKAGYIRAFIKLCQQVSSLPDDDSVQVFRLIFPDTAS